MYKIKAVGSNVPDILDSFPKLVSKYKFSSSFMKQVTHSKYTRPTPVQMQGMPIMYERRDAIVLAETGSGKSLAFLAPLIHMHNKGDGLKAVVVAPTRELAIQLYKEFLIFGKKGGGDTKNELG